MQRNEKQEHSELVETFILIRIDNRNSPPPLIFKIARKRREHKDGRKLEEQKHTEE